MRLGNHPCRRRRPFAQLGEAHIRTIFTDIDLPGSMDGLKLAAAVRDGWPPVHITVTTGMSRE